MSTNPATGLSESERARVQQAEAFWAVRLGRWFAMFARRKPLGFVGLLILLIVGGAALAAPAVAPYSYDTTDFGARLEGPTMSHFFGTDNLGRDTFSRT